MYFSIPCSLVPFALCSTLLLAACAGPREYFSVLPDQDGTTGQMTVKSHEGSTLVLDQSNASAIVRAEEVRPAKLSDAQIKEMYGEALAAQPPAPAHFVLYFVEGSDVLTQQSQRELDKVFSEIRKRPAPDLILIGHTDRVGTVADNDRLALRRAESMRARLISQGIPAEDIAIAGRGEREPLVMTADEVEEPVNRRVEIQVR